MKQWIKDLQIGDESLKKEIVFLDRKYPSLTKIITPNFVILKFNLVIDEPDFPFDVEHLHLVLKIAFPSARTLILEPSSMPPKIERRINDFILKRSTLPIKDLLRTIQRSLEALLTPLPDLKESKGITVVSSLSLQIQKSLLINDVKDELSNHLSKNSSHNKTQSSPASSSNALETSTSTSTTTSIYKNPIFLEPPPPPPSSYQAAIEVDTYFGEGQNIISLLYPISLSITLVCHRCQSQNYLPSLQRNQITITSCVKCKQHFESNFIPSIILKRKNCLGYLLLKRCSPFILEGVEAQLQCYECFSEILLSPLLLEKRTPYHCRGCPLNTQILLKDSKFITPLKRESDTEAKANGKTTEKLKGIAIGDPLPLHGACKHFKRSFRWFRFPCCNKAFACEICHNEAIALLEPNSPHVVEERAKRHICGWCSREMPVERTLCICGNEPGSKKAKTSHWEGGKGLRDRTKMSKKDRKKYSRK